MEDCGERDHWTDTHPLNELTLLSEYTGMGHAFQR